jgi:plasmid stabilization system protein ParE
MAFRVKTTTKADRDLDEILMWLLAEGAGETGFRWFVSLQKAMGSLANFPARCSIAPESATFPFEVRQLLYGHKANVYRVLFTIEGDLVVVLHVRRPGQDIISWQ